MIFDLGVFRDSLSSSLQTNEGSLKQPISADSCQVVALTLPAIQALKKTLKRRSSAIFLILGYTNPTFNGTPFRRIRCHKRITHFARKTQLVQSFKQENKHSKVSLDLRVGFCVL
jgi:hypothetical protein